MFERLMNMLFGRVLASDRTGGDERRTYNSIRKSRHNLRRLTWDVSVLSHLEQHRLGRR